MSRTQFEALDDRKRGTGLMKKADGMNGPCFYISVIDGPQANVVAGPYRTHGQALKMVEPARRVGRDKDPKCHFYGWGTVKRENGHKEGMLNKYLKKGC